MRQRERDYYESDFSMYIWEILPSNPSLAVKILNDTPRPILPSQREKRVNESEKRKRREKVAPNHFVCSNETITLS